IDVKPSNADGKIVILFESSSSLRIPDDKNQIFKPFSRGTDEEPGQGLGLSIASECVHLHGGDIHAENIKGKGAVVFHITLPKDLKIKKERNYG
ncbi:MAG: two-component system, sensor histidine kinase and response regulator, partial [Acidobacteriota bacterium]|nr:two-component system, sensor histidine kinase and response regulator [Acidobacteriota bacterium]